MSFSGTRRSDLVEDELERTRRDVETAYEAFQSTVAELETTNEELHAGNEELAAINEELGERTAALLRANVLLASVVERLRQCVIVVDAPHRGPGRRGFRE